MLKKSLIFLVCALLSVCMLCSCQNEKDFDNNRNPDRHGAESTVESSAVVDEPKTKTTQEFYEYIVENKVFWFKAEIRTNSQTYFMTQATNGSAVTNLLDYENDTDDRYEITEFKEGMANIHTLNFNEKKYDTTITKNYQDFLFAGEIPENYSRPHQKGDSKNSEYEYFERFETSATEGGEINGYNVYYFNDERLACIEIVENNVVTMTMKILDYGTSIPEGVYLTPPSDFSKGNLEIDTTIDFGSMNWGE